MFDDVFKCEKGSFWATLSEAEQKYFNKMLDEAKNGGYGVFDTQEKIDMMRSLLKRAAEFYQDKLHKKESRTVKQGLSTLKRMRNNLDNYSDLRQKDIDELIDLGGKTALIKLREYLLQTSTIFAGLSKEYQNELHHTMITWILASKMVNVSEEDLPTNKEANGFKDYIIEVIDMWVNHIQGNDKIKRA